MDEEAEFIANATREAKQRFLREEIIDRGYDADLFTMFCADRHGTDIDHWSFEEIQACVAEFQLKHDRQAPLLERGYVQPQDSQESAASEEAATKSASSVYSLKCVKAAATQLSLEDSVRIVLDE